MGAIEHSLEGHHAIGHSRTHTHTHISWKVDLTIIFILYVNYFKYALLE